MPCWTPASRPRQPSHGTGLWHRRGYRASGGARGEVTATDYSAAMLDAARIKLCSSPLAEFALIDLGALPPEPAGHSTELSNFGPLNCLDGWRPLARWQIASVRAGSPRCA